MCNSIKKSADVLQFLYNNNRLHIKPNCVQTIFKDFYVTQEIILIIC